MSKRKAEDLVPDVVVAPVGSSAESTSHWLQMVRKLVVTFGLMNVIVLATVLTSSVTGGEVNTFMWVRAGILLAATPLLYRWAARMERGWVPAYEKLRTVTVVLPIALVVVDFIPGVCPSWYAWLQVCAAITLFCVAGILRRKGIATLFAKDA